jgi:hypothetical protein
MAGFVVVGIVDRVLKGDVVVAVVVDSGAVVGEGPESEFHADEGLGSSCVVGVLSALVLESEVASGVVVAVVVAVVAVAVVLAPLPARSHWPAPSVRGSEETPGSWPGDQEHLQVPITGLRWLVVSSIRAVGVAAAVPWIRVDLKALDGLCLGCLGHVGRTRSGSIEGGSEEKDDPGVDAVAGEGSHARRGEVVRLVGCGALIALPQRAGRGKRRRPFARARIREKGRPCM